MLAHEPDERMIGQRSSANADLEDHRARAGSVHMNQRSSRLRPGVVDPCGRRGDQRQRVVGHRGAIREPAASLLRPAEAVVIALEADTSAGKTVHPHRDERPAVRSRRGIQEDDGAAVPAVDELRMGKIQTVGVVEAGTAEANFSGELRPILDAPGHTPRG